MLRHRERAWWARNGRQHAISWAAVRLDKPAGDLRSVMPIMGRHEVEILICNTSLMKPLEIAAALALAR